MKANLLFRENYPGGQTTYSFAGDALVADLELGRIFERMSNGDKVIYDVSQDIFLRPLQTADTIAYRHEVLADVRKNPDVVRKLYEITATTDQIQKYFLSPTRLKETFKNAVELIKIYTKLLKNLREVADKSLSDFKSEGFRNLFTMLQKELTDSYFSEVDDIINEMNNVDNIMISAKLGQNLLSVDYTLRRKEKGYWLRWQMAPSFTADAERDPKEIDDLYLRRDRGILEATGVLAQSAMYLESFFEMLRKELAFYVGCLNLTEKMRKLGMPMCVPVLLPVGTRERAWHGLYDVSLALTKGTDVVGNDLDAKDKRLYIITGANQGGKSTFLRSMGQAQLMAQCGMPVGADSFTAPMCRSLASHFKREEDSFMNSGRLDEELTRMSEIVDSLEPGSMMLFNESLSSTNEREGSEILHQITQALVENGVEIFSVTHLYTFATSFANDTQTQFLRAQRLEDRERTFKILPGEPLATAFGEDLYQKIFVENGLKM
jgi:DNA mismatch repair ATPase MutS